MRIALVTLGGTISSERTSTPGVVPVSGAAALGQDVVRWLPDVELVPVELRMTPSVSLTLDDVLALRDTIAALADGEPAAGARVAGAPVDGVVVSQGTDTIEEVAFALDLLGAAAAVPVVVTGALRDRSAPGGDGPANLVGAVLVAASAQARGAGVLVHLGDRSHAARWASKASTFATDAFSSEPFGPVAVVAEGRVTFGSRPVSLADLSSRPAKNGSETSSGATSESHSSVPDGAGARVLDRIVGLARVAGRLSPRVAVVQAGVGDDLALLAGLAPGYDAVVLAAAGAGHVSADAVPRVEALAARMPVVLCSRAGSGPGFTGTYGYPGGEIDLLARGVVPGGWLSPAKARVVVTLALAAGVDDDELRALVGAVGR